MADESTFYRSEVSGRLGRYWWALVRLGDRVKVMPGQKHYRQGAAAQLLAEIERSGGTAVGSPLTEVIPEADGGVTIRASALVFGPASMETGTGTMPTDIVDREDGE